MRLTNRLMKNLFRKHWRDFVLQEMPKHSVCAEIGVYRGYFASRILQVVQPLRLHLIDPWHYEEGDAYKRMLYGRRIGNSQARMDAIYQSVTNRFKEEIDTDRVVIHKASSVTASNKFDDQSLDWVYIDGDHHYEFVRQDLEIYYHKVKCGGYITGDDYGTKGWWQWPGLTQAVDEFRSTGLCETVLLQDSQYILRRI